MYSKRINILKYLSLIIDELWSLLSCTFIIMGLFLIILLYKSNNIQDIEAQQQGLFITINAAIFVINLVIILIDQIVNIEFTTESKVEAFAIKIVVVFSYFIISLTGFIKNDIFFENKSNLCVFLILFWCLDNVIKNMLVNEEEKSYIRTFLGGKVG